MGLSPKRCVASRLRAGDPHGRAPCRSTDCAKAQGPRPVRAPDGTRAHTGAGLGRLPLPLGYGSPESLAPPQTGDPDAAWGLLVCDRLEPEPAVQGDAGGVVATGARLDGRA